MRAREAREARVTGSVEMRVKGRAKQVTVRVAGGERVGGGEGRGESARLVARHHQLPRRGTGPLLLLQCTAQQPHLVRGRGRRRGRG